MDKSSHTYDLFLSKIKELGIKDKQLSLLLQIQRDDIRNVMLSHFTYCSEAKLFRYLPLIVNLSIA